MMKWIFKTSLALAFLLITATYGAADNSPTLRLDKETFSAGEKIAVHFTAPASYQHNAWVGIIPSDIPHGKEAVNDQHDIDYQYLEGRTSGTLTFEPPARQGNYDFR